MRAIAMIAGLVAGLLGVVVGAAPKPHILMVIVDDFGFANTGYHRQNASTPEVSTPAMDGLVEEGILLMRHYVHPECTPSRVAFQTGRLPMHSGQPGLCSPTSVDCGIPYNATTIATKLASVGYKTHHVGKWDAGMATPTHTPVGRGFQSSLNYFGHGNYQWSETEWGGAGSANKVPDPTQNPALIRDLWDSHKPAYIQANASYNNKIYEESLFLERMTAILADHNPSDPLFLNYCARIAHYPIQAPAEYQKRPNIASIDVPHRLVYHAQIEYLDDQLGNLTNIFKTRGMWNNTLMILTSDNGGYTKALGECTEFDPVKGVTCMSGEAGANNYPLRGGKYSFFEGGIRSNSFVSGGFLPSAVRGTTLHGVLHIADHYATFCGLAGVDVTDPSGDATGIPPVDSLDMWPMISGQNLTSPRAELFISTSCLIQGDWKLLTGFVSSASWPGPIYPNASSSDNYLSMYTAKCNPGCLYNVGVDGDMTEHNDLATAEPTRLQAMLQRLSELVEWTNKSTPYDASCQKGNTVFHNVYKGFYGPFCEIGTLPPTPSRPTPPYHPTPNKSCTYRSNSGLRPVNLLARTSATSETDCCKQCISNPRCTNAVFQNWYPEERRTCNMHSFTAAPGTFAVQINSTVCLTGRPV